MKKVYIHPFGRPIREPLWQRIAKWVATVATVITFALLLPVLLIEWMAGCGESYVDAKGVRHQHECLFIPNQKEK